MKGLNLTREMKLVLVLLLMVALIGGWFVVTNRSAPDPVAATPAAQPGEAQPTASTAAPARSGETGTAAPAASTPLATGGQIEVATLPPFPVPGAAASGAALTPAPGGINPDQALLTLGASNPFRPLQLAPVEGSGPPATPSADAAASQDTGTAPAGAQATGPITVPQEAAPVARVPAPAAPVPVTPVPVTPVPEPRRTATANPVGGAVPITRLPGTGSGTSDTGRAASGSADTGRAVPNVVAVSGGALPTVTVPGAQAPARPATASGAARPGAATPAAAVPGAATPRGTTPVATPPAAPAPVAPPIVGVTAPRETQAAPVGTAAAGGAAAGGAPASGTQAGTSQAGTSPADAASGSAAGGEAPTLAVPTPQVITRLGQSGAPAAGTPAAGTALDRVLAERGVRLDGVVLGPVNTAVFRTGGGFVVVSVGQTLPDTDVVLREVTATTATLALGDNVTTLQLEQR
ncbi:hypothetical protein [Deinococcus petrolearius]|uniref:Uncharacterized protein n=1 Tax=Deinococcus petrolearius TaxID=1751295 RepID=A0ABW1DI08_9DEIO